MGYNRVRTPRAYIDKISRDFANGWRDAADLTTVRTDSGTFTLDHGHIMDLFDLKPHKYITIPKETKEFYIQFNTGYGTEYLGESNFVAILGHNMHSASVNFRVQISDSVDMSSPANVSDADYAGFTNVVNAGADADNAWISPQSNGWSLFTWTDSGDGTGDNRYLRITIKEDDDAGDNFLDDLHIGSLMYGEFLDFPANVDVGYTVQYSYDSNKINRAIGGSDYSTMTHVGSPMWASTTAWEIFDSTTNIGSTSSNPYLFKNRPGRKSLSLNFSNVADTNMFVDNEYLSADYLDSTTFQNAMYQNSIGSHLPFLLSIDNTSTNTKDFGMFRASSDLTAKQVAANTFNFRMDLTETW